MPSRNGTTSRRARASEQTVTPSVPVPATSSRPSAPIAQREESGEGLSFEIAGLRYGLDRAPRKNGRRSVISVRLADGAQGPPFVDRADLYSFRSRHAFAALVAEVFGRQTGDVLGALALVLDECERAATRDTPATTSTLTPARRKAAEKILAAPRLLDRAADALEAAGFVGEPTVKRLAFLIATSRLLARPLNGLLLAPPASGKSSVLDAVAALMPEEHVVPLARITPQSLFYMGQDALRHRLVLVDEFDGQAEAAHAIRVLQSRGELRLSLTLKGRAESFLVRGPVSVMSGSSSSDIDLQNTSRCLELVLDDSSEQTKRVQAAQARSWAGLGRSPLDLDPWRDAQRLLAEDGLPRDVVIPFAPKLSFPARTTSDRRASAKILGLVAAHGLLYARQRATDAAGRLVATPADYSAVHALLRPVVEREVDGLSPRAAALYRALAGLQTSRANEDAALSRRDAAALMGWGYSTARRALDEMVAHELVARIPKKFPQRYRLADGSLLGQSAALTDPGELD